VQQKLVGSSHFQQWAARMHPYVEFTERATTGEDLVQAIPKDELQVVVLAGDDRPLLPLFRPYSLHRKVLFLPPHAPPRDLNQLETRYVITGGGVEISYPELCAYLKNTDDYQLVMEREYTSKLARGPETWRLYRRNPSGGQLLPDSVPK
jgi:hypothetical protein